MRDFHLKPRIPACAEMTEARIAVVVFILLLVLGVCCESGFALRRADLYRDEYGNALEGAIPQADHICQLVLSANASQQTPIPSFVSGGVASGTFQVGETVTQSGTSASGTLMRVPGAGGPLILGALSAGANNTATWVGGTSGAVFAPSGWPASANLVLLEVSGGNDFAMKFVSSAIAWPTSNITDGTAPEIDPLMRTCVGQSWISVVSPANCIVTMGFFQ
jgi:hypothetical protein